MDVKTFDIIAGHLLIALVSAWYFARKDLAEQAEQAE